MKVVGKTDGGYLCQISEYEIGVITGYGSYPRGGEDKSKRFAKATGRDTASVPIPTNTEIQILMGLQYIEGIRSKVRTVGIAAAALREMADMLDKPLPTVLEPPETEPSLKEPT